MTQHKQQSCFDFVTPELTHRVELILHLLEYSNHLVIVKGEHESGKTTLCEELSSQAETNLIIRKLSVSAHTTKNDIFKTIINDAFDSDEEEKEFNQDELNQWLSRCQNKQQIPALLIDNVDLFSDELLNVLFEIIASANKVAALHVCLFCEPSFLDRLDEPGIDQDESRSLHIIEMPGLSEKQTEQYIKSKYPSNEISDLSLFDDKTIKQMHRISHGMPGRINALCEQYLDDPAKKPEVVKEKISIDIGAIVNKNKNIITVVVLLLIFSVGVTTLLYKTEKKEDKQTIKLALPEEKQEHEIKELVQKDVMPEEMQEPEPVEVEDLSTSVIPALAQDAERTVEVIEVDDAMSQTAPEVKEAQVPSVEETEDALSKSDEKMVTTSNDIEPVVEPAPEPAPEPEPEPKATAVVKKDINWLIKQNPDNYVLQLIGANEEKTIEFYLRSFKNFDDKIISFSTTHNGKPWHVLVYGLYENRYQAVTAIEGLPQKAKQMAPWPRTVASIQKLMQEASPEQ